MPKTNCDLLSDFLSQVCLEKMQDLQLALVIARLYESEFETASTYKKILQRHILGHDKQVHIVLVFMSQAPRAVILAVIVVNTARCFES